jgi:hypothetical protein
MKSLKADLPALAELIRSQGRGRDTVLAHITPQEAALLKKRGGSGTINPDTGLPEFQEDYGFDYGGGDYGGGGGYGGFDVPDAGAEAATMAQFPEYYPSGAAPTTTFEPYVSGYDVPGGGFYPGGEMPTPSGYDVGGADVAFRGGAVPEALPGTERATLPGVTTPPQAEKSFLEKLGISQKDAIRLGLGATLAGGLTAANVARTRQAGQQAQAARGELAALGKPYQETGAQLTGAAQRGELTPSSQQALQAAQAQMAQGVATRGGVGAAQMQTQIAGLRNLLLENQYNFGLRVAQIGDNYAMGAIKSGMEADRAIGTANQQFYGQLAQLLAPFITGASSPTPNVRTT